MWKSKTEIPWEISEKWQRNNQLRCGTDLYLFVSSHWSQWGHWNGQAQFSVLSYFIQFGTEIIRWISEYYRPRSSVDSSLRFSLLWLRSLSYNFLPERPYFVQEQKDHFSTHLPSVFLILGIFWEIDSMTILNFK